MGSTADKVKGAANEAIGKAKQGVGEAVGSDRLQGEGVIQEIKGKGQKAVGDAKEATKDAVNKAAAAANKNFLIGARLLNGKTGPLGRSFSCSVIRHGRGITAVYRVALALPSTSGFTTLIGLPAA